MKLGHVSQGASRTNVISEAGSQGMFCKPILTVQTNAKLTHTRIKNPEEIICAFLIYGNI